MIIQKAVDLIVNVTKHGATCYQFLLLFLLLLFLFYLAPFHVTYFIFMQFECNYMQELN